MLGRGDVIVSVGIGWDADRDDSMQVLEVRLEENSGSHRCRDCGHGRRCGCGTKRVSQARTRRRSVVDVTLPIQPAQLIIRCRERARAALEFHYRNERSHQSDERPDRPNPHHEHPLHDPGLERGHRSDRAENWRSHLESSSAMRTSHLASDSANRRSHLIPNWAKRRSHSDVNSAHRCSHYANLNVRGPPSSSTRCLLPDSRNVWIGTNELVRCHKLHPVPTTHGDDDSVCRVLVKHTRQFGAGDRILCRNGLDNEIRV